jgi:hypothetical protein
MSRIAARVLILALLGVVPSAVAAGDLYVDPAGLCGGNSPCYTDLAAALAAAVDGDVIHVGKGLYPLAARLDVTQSVRILGPQAGVNPLPSNSTARVPGDANEAILDGGGSLATLVRILADDVEINGLELRNGTGDLLDSPSGTPRSNVAVRNNIVHGSSTDEGIQLRGVTGAVIECNHVYDTAGDGINLCCSSTGGLIRWNEVHDIASPDALIYVYNSTNTTIQGNLVYNSATNEGIKLGAKHGPDSLLVGGSIIGNTVHDTQQDCIAVYTSDVLVSCNTLYGSTSENGAIYLAYGISNVSVVDNVVYNCTFQTFKSGIPAAIMLGTQVHASTITVSGNSLVNNLPHAMTNLGVGVLTAENNWWGAADGPGPVGPGSGGLVSTQVDFDPWLVAAPSPACPPRGTCGLPPVSVESCTWQQLKSLYR